MELTVFFKCLSGAFRFKLISLIVENQKLRVCDLMCLLDEPCQPRVSRELALLREANILQVTKQKRWVYYSISNNLPSWGEDIIHLAITNYSNTNCESEPNNTLAK